MESVVRLAVCGTTTKADGVASNNDNERRRTTKTLFMVHKEGVRRDMMFL